MSEKRCGPSDKLEIRDYQIQIVNEILDSFNNGKRNVFVSLPQGSGKTIIALLALTNLVNEGSVSSVLVLIPRRVLVNQWVDKAHEMFYGLGLLRNPTLSKMEIEKIRGWLKHSQQALGIVMTDQSYQRYMKKAYFSESDFDLVIIDEAADSVVARDFIEGFRMSEYLSGLEEWQIRKIFLLPYHVSEKKIRAMMSKFGKDSVLIRKIIEDLPVFQYTVNDPLVIDDPIINTFVDALEEYYKRIRINTNRILTKYGVEGYRENLETLLNPKVLERLKKIYGMDDETLEQIKTLITKYILVQHLKKWFLYSNREELSRSILASQFEVNEWLSTEDKKLNKLAEVVKDYLSRDYKIYIFSQYVSTAELIESYLKEKLNLRERDITLITGLVEDQWDRLDAFKRAGRILVTTPVLDKGADIPLRKGVAIIFTPPLSTEKLFQVIGRIRGGEITFLAYKGSEEETMNQVAEEIRRHLAEGSGEKYGLNRYI